MSRHGHKEIERIKRVMAKMDVTSASAEAHSLDPLVRNRAPERPILFSGDMVRMIRLGRKTHTRRVVKFPLVDRNGTGCEIAGCEINSCLKQGLELCPHGIPGSRLWVRETWRPQDGMTIACQHKDEIEYRADGERSKEPTDCWWKPSIFMPRWASRITLEIVAIRAERLQDISDGDCLAEGILTSKDRGMSGRGFRNYHQPDYSFSEPWNSYRTLWEVINGKASWADNPWVWVIEFKEIFNVPDQRPATP
jgi:hypothetical protein